MRSAALVLAAVALFVTGCSPLGLLNWVNPEPGYDRIELAYGGHPRQRLDLYRPKGATGPLPVVVFFYGGGWEAGDRAGYRFAALALVEQGFVVAVPDYRVYPEVVFPIFLEDSANNAAMLALDPRPLAAEGVPAAAISGMVGLAGPYDFLPLTSKTLQAIFAVPDMAKTQPIAFARKDAPPMLLATGDGDGTVYPRNTRNLGRRLTELGAPVETIEYAGLGHAGIVIALSPLFRGTAPVLADVTRFLRARS
jgi:acetyl esterase/lipase